MNDAFVNVLNKLKAMPQEKVAATNRSDTFDDMLESFNPEGSKKIRDRIILLLYYRYRLMPLEIVELNLDDVRPDAGLIVISSRKKGIVALRQPDILAFRQWTALRQIYQRSEAEIAYLISLHWTLGRSQPFCRLSTRAVNYVINSYREAV